MNTKYIILSAIAACSVLFSCQEPTPEIEPIFPEAVTKTVKAGEEVVISFNANMDWTLSVPENTLNTFWLDDNGFSTYKVTGKAADGINVTVNVSEVESFEDQSCDVTLTMGASSKVIAKIIRSSKDPVLSVYVAEVEDGEVKYTEDGQDYLYGGSEAADIDLFWTGSDFRLPIMVVSNFSWTYEAPEWISIDVPENGADTVKVNVFGVPSKYPLEPTSGKIRFKFADKVVKEYNVSIPGCEDIYSYSVGMSLTELTFNYSGKFKTVTGFIDGPATATISGTKDVDVFAVEVVDGKYVLGNQAGPSWLNVDVDPFDSSEGADVLQTRNVSISVAQNEGEERSAAIFFMPPTGWSSKESIFNEDMESVKEEYIKRRDYMIEGLNKIEGVFTPLPMGAFYTIAELPVDDTENFARWMLENFRIDNETTMVTPAASFYKTPGKGKNHARIAYVLEVEEMDKALKILEEGLKAYPGRTL